MTYQQTYQEWLDHLDENDPLRKQLVDIKDDEVEKCETLCYVADMTKRSGYPLK